jgi:hypothetical protein
MLEDCTEPPVGCMGLPSCISAALHTIAVGAYRSPFFYLTRKGFFELVCPCCTRYMPVMPTVPRTFWSTAGLFVLFYRPCFRFLFGAFSPSFVYFFFPGCWPTGSLNTARNKEPLHQTVQEWARFGTNVQTDSRSETESPTRGTVRC